jgi:hypothetical protein
MISILFAGFSGGVVRGLVGFIKHQQSYKEVPFRPLYFASMVTLSGVIGLLAAWVTDDLGITFLGMDSLSVSIALIIGYAGGDLIENLFKIIIKKPNLYTLPIFK